MRPTVYVKLDGVLAEAPEFESRWAIGAKLPQAEEVLAFAREIGNPVVYGIQAESPRGQRTVMRWLWSHLLDAEVTYIQDPPEDAEVITTWPKSSMTTSDQLPGPAAVPATGPST